MKKAGKPAASQTRPASHFLLSFSTSHPRRQTCRRIPGRISADEPDPQAPSRICHSGKALRPPAWAFRTPYRIFLCLPRRRSRSSRYLTASAFRIPRRSGPYFPERRSCRSSRRQPGTYQPLSGMPCPSLSGAPHCFVCSAVPFQKAGPHLFRLHWPPYSFPQRPSGVL